jgi:hypothetical protein
VLLAFLALVHSPGPGRSVLDVSLVLILLIIFTVFAIRDLAPLCTYHGLPADGNGWPLWTLIGDLTLIGIIVPLLMPRQYVPIEPAVRITWTSTHASSHS